MNSNLKFSIITPVLNGEKYLPGLFKSLDDQLYRNFEHIIIDGGSNDNSKNIIKDYATSHGNIITIFLEKDEGMYDAINYGLVICSGDVISYLNVDDRYFPWSLKVVMENYVSKSIMYGEVLQLFDLNGNFIYYPKIYPNFINRRFFASFTLGQPSCFISKEVIKNVGKFDQSLKYNGDTEYWVRSLSKNIKFIKINEFLSVDYNNNENLRSKYKVDLNNELKDIIKNYNIPEQNNAYRKIKSSAMIIMFILNINLFSKSKWIYFKKRFKVSFSIKNKVGLLNVKDTQKN